jgi:nicotinamidase-related amidase
MLKMLIIDPQNDFCDVPGAALPVAGAVGDLRRLAQLIPAVQPDAIYVTLDSHPSVAVERTTFWQQGDGSAMAPFTVVCAADVQAGRYVPRNQALRAAVLAMLAQLEATGRAGMVVWPVHCVTGSWGHAIAPDLLEALNAWEFATQRAVHKVLKGEYYLSEHFGVFEADAPDANVPSTLFNTALAQSLLQDASVVLVAGEASSHCVASSVDQLVRHMQRSGATQPALWLLRDCMSPVTGFEASAQAFLARAQAWGAKVLSAEEAQQALRR